MRFAFRVHYYLMICMFLFLPFRNMDAAQKPNIVLIFIDDMGWADFSCFGNKYAVTPNIDQMAKEGIAFEKFYVNSPICSPSRVAISTGQYPQRWQITSYLAHRKRNAERGMANWLDPKAPMLVRSLKQVGYATGHYGKWHMGGQRDVTDAPPITDYGFDTSLTNFEGMGAKLLPLTLKPGQKKPKKIWASAEILGKPVTWTMRCEITGGFVRQAIGFIDKAQKDSKPFYINLWPDDVHSPFFPSVKNWGDSKRDLYMAVLEEMDKQLGPLFNRIKNDPKLKDNTLVLMCSDNGHAPGAGHALHLKGCKTNLYEGGIRSPLVVWGPGLMREQALGTRNKTSIFSAIDLVPSLIKLAGAKSAGKYDGEELLDVVLGQSQASRKAPLFFSRPPDRKNYYGYEALPDLAVRRGKWKLLCDYDGGRPVLHDLEQDESEQANIAGKHPELSEELTKLAVDWYKQVTPK